MTGSNNIPEGNYLFQIYDAAKKLCTTDAIHYHHLVAKLLYLGKHMQPDLLLAVSFLSTQIYKPDVDDCKILGHCLCYVCESKHLPLTCKANNMSTLQCWVDASFAVHPNCWSHIGATLSTGKGFFFSTSSKQKLNTQSSTEAGLAVINDSMSMIIWVCCFLEDCLF